MEGQGRLEVTSQSPLQSQMELSIQTRCPSCLKLYTVDRATAGNESAVFECTACHAEFSLIAAPVFATETQSQLLEPSPNQPIHTEIDATTLANEMALGAKPELILLWKKIIDDYQDEFLHDGFVQACRDANALGYAASKYARILKEFPQEELARRMRDKVRALSSAEIDATNAARGRMRPSLSSSATTSATKQNTSNSSVGLPIMSMTALAIVLATILIFVGSSIPGQKNLSAVGVSMLALVIGVRFIYQRNKTI